MSHERKTLVTLDFDGVVSPLPNNWHPRGDEWVNIWEQEGADDPYPWHTFEFGFSCSIRENVGTFLHELNAMPDVDVVWLTSWDQGTQYFEEKSDGFVPHFEFLSVRHKFGRFRASKSTALLKRVSETRPTHVISFEDDSPVIRAFRKVHVRYPEIQFTAIKSDSYVGITDEHIGSARALIQSIREAE